LEKYNEQKTSGKSYFVNRFVCRRRFGANAAAVRHTADGRRRHRLLRRFNRGTLLRYSYVVYNAKTDKTQKPQLQIQTRLIRDGKVILEGSPTPFNVAAQTDLRRLQASGAITLGNDLTPGNYILQVIVFDNVNGGKRRFATQFVEFEIIK